MFPSGLKGNEFAKMVEVGQSFAGQTITGVATVNGATISEPWRKASKIAFLINVGAISATFAGTVRFQGLRRDDGTTWENLKANDGTTDLTGGDAKLVDTGAGEDACLLATLELQRVDGETYEAVRIQVNGTVAAQTIVVGVCHLLLRGHERPSSQADEVRSQQYPS